MEGTAKESCFETLFLKSRTSIHDKKCMMLGYTELSLRFTTAGMPLKPENGDWKKQPKSKRWSDLTFARSWLGHCQA